MGYFSSHLTFFERDVLQPGLEREVRRIEADARLFAEPVEEFISSLAEMKNTR